MRAVWSFWSVPYREARNFSWREELYHRLSWVLSLERARPHFSSTALYTDQAGAALLVDKLGLRFDAVVTTLDKLSRDDPDWWTLGKLLTYSQQEEPFVHIDADAYVFSALPERMLSAALLAQNPEPVLDNQPWYPVEGCEVALRTRGGGRIPAAWSWYRTFSPVQQAACCGIFGGNALPLIHTYAETALGLLRGESNRHAFDHWDDKRVLNPFFEQYLLSACAAYAKVKIEYLFDSHAQAASGAAVAAGFAHLMAHSKYDAGVTQRLEQRVARDYPAAYKRCVESLASPPPRARPFRVQSAPA